MPHCTGPIERRHRASPWFLAFLLVFAGATLSDAAAQDPLRRLQAAMQPGAPRAERVAALQGVADAGKTGKLSGARAARALVAVLSAESMAELETETLQALARIDDPLAASTLLERSVEASTTSARSAARLALSRSPASSYEPQLVRGLDDRRWGIRAQAALMLAERGAYDRIDDLIGAFKGEKHIAVLSALAEALEKLTLAVLPVKASAWKHWLEENPDWEPAIARESAASGGEPGAASDPSRTEAAPVGPQKPRAYGLVPRFEHFEIEAEVVLIAVDVSTSMLRHGARAREDARSLALALPTHVEALVMAFTDTIADLDRTFAPLDVARKLAIDGFLDQQQAGGGTDFETSLLSAIDHADHWFESHPRDPREIEIIFFSDGDTSGRKPRTAATKVERAMRKLTLRHPVRMSFVASTGEASAVMVHLAELSGGHLVLGDRPRTVGPLDR